MRISVVVGLLGAGLLAGCGNFPPPPDPVRLVDSPTDVSGCRSLGPVGEPVRTDGLPPPVLNSLIFAGPSHAFFGGFGGGETGDNLAARITVMRDEAFSRGATDLLLTRRILRDWSYIQGTAYRCRH
jgi:hypothetical protein